MHRYSRAYRDANSPLTPLTPLPTNVFDFNIDTTSSGATLSLPGSGRQVTLPRVRQRVSSCAGTSNRAITPKSCESALKKRNSYVRVIAKLGGGENIAKPPVPPARTKRTIKQEPTMCSELPTIKLQPPPRTKRRGTLEHLNANVKSEEYVMEDFLPTCQSTFAQQQRQQQQQQLLPQRHFNASNVRLASPVAPKPMSPRFGEFLKRWGINCLKSIFERQEIDLQTFCCLTADDLECLGIQDPNNRERVIQAINFVSGFRMNSGFE